MSLTLNERIVATTDALWTVVVHLNSQLDPICQIIGRALIQAQQQRFRVQYLLESFETFGAARRLC
jgi:hypothetical protein